MVRLVSFVVFFVTALVVFERLVSKRGVRWRAYAPAVLFAAITWTHLPLKLVFQSEFERMASAIDEGSMLKTPFWTGPFEIKRVGGDHDSDPPFLATNTGDHDIVGFVMHPKGHGYPVWSCITLDKEWSYTLEDGRIGMRIVSGIESLYS